MTTTRTTNLAATAAFTLLALTGCGSSTTDAQSTAQSTALSTAMPTAMPTATVDGATVPTPKADPADFSTTVDNPYYPLRPGMQWRYDVTGDEGHQTDVVTVQPGTRVVQGVTTLVVRDVARSDKGEVLESTYDWFAQDTDGNVWYFGEDTTAYDHGKPDKGGSWEAGKHGAHAGIVMLAHPDIGDSYKQEYRKGVAEDQAKILSLSAHRTEPLASYDGLVQTQDTSPLEPRLIEQKWYANGVGDVHEETIAGGVEKVELVSFRRR